MKFTADRDALRAAIATCMSIVDRKNTLAILTNLVLRVDGGVCRIQASNLREEMSIAVAVTGGKPGAICVSAQDFASRVGAMPAGEVTVKLQETDLLLTAWSRKFKLGTVSAEDFPKLAEVPAATSEVSADTLSMLIGATKHAVSTNEARPAINSALLTVEGGRIAMRATDGHRMVIVSFASDAAPLSVLIPLRGLTALHALCDAAGENLRVASEGSRAFFVEDDATLAVSIPDAPFPPLDDVVPGKTAGVVVSREALSEAVKAVSVSAPANGMVRLVADGGLALSCGKDGHDVVETEADDGCKLGTFIHAKYLADALAAMTTERVHISHRGDPNPILILPVDDKSAKRVCAVMPMRGDV